MGFLEVAKCWRKKFNGEGGWLEFISVSAVLLLDDALGLAELGRELFDLGHALRSALRKSGRGARLLSSLLHLQSYLSQVLRVVAIHVKAKAVDAMALVQVQQLVDLFEAQFHRLARPDFLGQLLLKHGAHCHRAKVGSRHFCCFLFWTKKKPDTHKKKWRR